MFAFVISNRRIIGEIIGMIIEFKNGKGTSTVTTTTTKGVRQ